MSTITKDGVRALALACDHERLLALFDREPDRVRRYLTRLAYHPDDPAQRPAVAALRELARKRAHERRDFFLETMRRHLWAMNEEGANVAWSAPELVGAVVAGAPDLFGKFFGYAFCAAIDEPIFQPSLLRAYDMVAQAAPQLTEAFADRAERLRAALGDRA